MHARARLGLTLLAAIGCARPVIASPTPSEPAEQRAETDVSWPALVAGEREGPSLHRGSRTGRGFAWIAGGTPISVRGAVRNGRARAYVDGALRVRGWMDVSAFEAVVLERGRVAGSPLYLVPGMQVRVVRIEGALALVEGEAQLAHPALARSPSFRGTFPLARLGAALAGGGTGPTPGRAVTLRRATELAERPGGAALWTIPSLDPPLGAVVLREEGDHLGVRIGVGPYLVGFVPRSALVPEPSGRKDPFDPEVIDPWAGDRGEASPPRSPVANPWAREPDEDVEDADDERSWLPARLREATVRPVWGVRAGARVHVDGTTVAIFREPGAAVELERWGDRVEVLAAVDDTVTVRGSIALGDLVPPPP